MNPLKGAIASMLEKPNLALAGVFFLLPFVFAYAIMAFFGFEVYLPAVGVDVAIELAYWAIAAGILYILLKVIMGSEMKGNFVGIAAAYSYLFVLRFLMMVLFVLFIAILLPGFLPGLAGLQGSTVEDYALFLQNLSKPDEGFILGASIFALLVFVLLICTSIYVMYEIVSLSGNKAGAGKNVIVLVLEFGFLMVLYTLPALI